MNQNAWIREYGSAVCLTVRVTPRASRSALGGVAQDCLRVRLQAPPTDGRANQALLRLLADRLQIARSALSILSGETARVKRVLIRQLPAEVVAQRLGG